MFDENFKFGVSLSGFQFEMGGSQVDENTDWYNWSTNTMNAYSGLVSGDNPENGPNYWENYKKFHQLAENAGMSAFRIGLEWSRIFPEATFGVDSRIEDLANMEAVSRYREILEDLTGRGLDVMIDLNHFTLPTWAHDPLRVNREKDMEKAGWVDERLPKEFEKFARFSVRQFDKYANSWSTMNEPNVVASLGYLSPQAGFPPAIIAPDMFAKAMKNQARAHNLAYEAMKEETDQPVGLIYATAWFDGDETAEEAFEYSNYRFLDRTMSNADFLGVNYYTRNVVEKRDEGLEIGGEEINWKVLPGYGYACPPNGSSNDDRFATDNGWEYYPEGLEKVLLKLADRYGKPMFVTENGTADARDTYRPYYLLAHLDILEKIEEKVDLRGYFHWSLVDNFEWAEGFDKRFGLVYVDFEDKEYTPRPSYYLYQEIINQRTVGDHKKLLNLLDGENGAF